MLPVLEANGAMTPTQERPVNRLNHFLDRFFHEGIFSPVPAGIAAVPLSIWEDDNQFCVELDAPGIAESDIEVEVHNGVLFIRGERKCERTGKGYDTRTYGRFEQRIGLPTWAKADMVEAKLTNGVLSLTFPKGEDAKPRKIALKTK